MFVSEEGFVGIRPKEIDVSTTQRAKIAWINRSGRPRRRRPLRACLISRATTEGRLGGSFSPFLSLLPLFCRGLRLAVSNLKRRFLESGLNVSQKRSRNV